MSPPPTSSNKPSWLPHETKVQQIANKIRVFEFQLLLDNINVGFYVQQKSLWQEQANIFQGETIFHQKAEQLSRGKESEMISQPFSSSGCQPLFIVIHWSSIIYSIFGSFRIKRLNRNVLAWWPISFQHVSNSRESFFHQHYQEPGIHYSQRFLVICVVSTAPQSS